jgi:hypothetical protein
MDARRVRVRRQVYEAHIEARYGLCLWRKPSHARFIRMVRLTSSSRLPSSDSTAMLEHQRLRTSDALSPDAQRYLAQRLDGARDLYVVALAIGTRDEGRTRFGRMIREARIHFIAVIEEARIAGLDTTEIGAVLSSTNIEDGIRPELRVHVEQLLTEAGSRGQRREKR